MFNLAAALGNQPLPPGRRVAILTNAGGPAILCADACEAAGLAVPELSEKATARLAAFLPSTASLRNPVDMIASASPEDFGQCTRTLLSCGEVDALIVICVSAGVCDGGAVMRAIQESVAFARTGGAGSKPVLACLMPEQSGLSLAACKEEKIPCYAFPETAARVLGKAAVYGEWRAKPLGCTPELGNIDLASARSVCK